MTTTTADHVIVRTLWPVLVAAVISLFPFTVYATFLVPIADSTGQDAAAVGMLRGLGGISALIAGVACAPLIARWAAPHATATGLALLAATSLLATVGTFPTLVVFCIGIGAATATLTPTLLRTATAAFRSSGDAGRAATIVTATQSLAAVLAAQVIGVIGLAWGWRGALWVTAGAAAVTAALFLRAPRGPEPPDVPRLRYAETFTRLRARSDLLALIAIAFLRTTAFMGCLAVLAAHYHDRFTLEAAAFTLVWTLSGAAFFTGNFLAGRWARAGIHRQRRLLCAGLLGAAAAVVAVFTVDLLPLALAATAVMGFSHAVVAAAVTTLIADRGGELTAPAYSVTAAGMSLGVFCGAVLAGVGLALGAGAGAAASLGFPTLLAVALVPVATRARPSSA